MFAEKGDPWVVLTYAMILFFVVCFSYYQLKVSKVKVWWGVLEAVGLLMIEYLFMVLAGLALVYYDLIPLAYSKNFMFILLQRTTTDSTDANRCQYLSVQDHKSL